MRVLPAGDRHLLLDLTAGAAEACDAAVEQRVSASCAEAAVRARQLPGVVDALPAAVTVLVSLAPGARPGEVAADLTGLVDDLAQPDDASGPHREPEEPVVEIPVVYDGDDLADVARILGTTPADVVARHSSVTWRCAFVGFAPGFAYLRPDVGPEGAAGGQGEGWQPPLTVPRREQSRTSVPAGSVALADGYSAVYPRPTPGGWQLIGRTDALLWDAARPQPCLVPAGTRVRFVDVTAGAA